MRRALFVLALLMIAPAGATTVNKCVDAAGQVTFTQTACPPHTVLQKVLEVENRPPSGNAPPVPLAVPQPQQAERPPAAAPAPLQPQPPVVIQPDIWYPGYVYPLRRPRREWGYPGFHYPASPSHDRPVPPLPVRPRPQRQSGEGVRLGAERSTEIRLQPEAPRRHHPQHRDERPR